ncbi:hypothetical protein INT47_008447, partial [Mucor saturninus]
GVNECSVRLQIWDTAGQERFRAMAPMYYRGASAAILVYDITSEESFKEMVSWMEELNKNMTDDLVIHVVGNKLDLESKREVSFMKVLDYCDQLSHGVSGINEVSAKHNIGIEEIFLDITQTLVGRKYNLNLDRTPTTDIHSENIQYEKSGCC